jgi:hypothetical protein
MLYFNSNLDIPHEDESSESGGKAGDRFIGYGLLFRAIGKI